MQRRYRSSARHFQRNGQRTPCGLVNPARATSVAGPDVTCKKCLAAINTKTTEQGGPAKAPRSNLTNVILTALDRERWINTIKVVRELAPELGLREAKELVDKVRDGEPQNLLINCTRHQARKAREAMRGTYAVVRISKTIVALTLVLVCCSIIGLGQRRMPLPEPEPVRSCFSVLRPGRPHLADYPTYVNGRSRFEPRVSLNNVNDSWVQGRIYPGTRHPYFGLADWNVVQYDPPGEDGNSPNEWDALYVGWNVLVTVDHAWGLIVVSPFGSWYQMQEYDPDVTTATVRIWHRNGRLFYYLNGKPVFSQAAPGLEERDLRAYYRESVDEPLIGLKNPLCRYLPETFSKKSLDFLKQIGYGQVVREH